MGAGKEGRGREEGREGGEGRGREGGRVGYLLVVDVVPDVAQVPDGYVGHQLGVFVPDLIRGREGGRKGGREGGREGGIE